jgi:hypothetical protein
MNRLVGVVSKPFSIWLRLRGLGKDVNMFVLILVVVFLGRRSTRLEHTLETKPRIYQ